MEYTIPTTALAVKTCYVKFFAPVNAASANQLMTVIDQKVAAGYERIVLLLSTPGGTVLHGLSLHNYLAGIPVLVETHNFGSVDSIGVVIFSAGSHRYSAPDARFLMHPVSLQMNGTFELDKLEEQLKGMRIDTENIAATIARATGKQEEDLMGVIRRRTTLSPEEAMDFGLVHEIRKELFPRGAEVVSLNIA